MTMQCRQGGRWRGLPSRTRSLSHSKAPRLSRRVVRISAAKKAEEAQVRVVLGTQWGDEGKGKLVDILAQQSDLVCRAQVDLFNGFFGGLRIELQGGANAGHTIYDPSGKRFALHVVPSGILNPKAMCLIGNGVVVNVPSLIEELENISAKGVQLENRLFVSDRAHVLLDLHKEIDGMREAELAGNKIGTTRRGIGPAYASKANRLGVRMCDLRQTKTLKDKIAAVVEDARKRFEGIGPEVLDREIDTLMSLRDRMLPFVADTVSIVNDAYDRQRRILIEGGQATMLDIDFGTYPFVTSSNPSIGGCISGLGLAANKIDAVYGVTKAYTSRVGEGPYPTEVFGELAEELRTVGGEFGTTTGRPRRVGWLDIVSLNYTARSAIEKYLLASEPYF